MTELGLGFALTRCSHAKPKAGLAVSLCPGSSSAGSSSLASPAQPLQPHFRCPFADVTTATSRPAHSDTRHIDAAFTGRRRIAGCDRDNRSWVCDAHVRPLITRPSPSDLPAASHTGTLTPTPSLPDNFDKVLSMSAQERSPKRQRRSYSPPSPPTSKPAFVAQHPHTPPPSVHMSPTWTAQASSLQQGGGVTFPTPPGTSGHQGHMTDRASGSEEVVGSGKGTPSGTGETARRDGEGDVSMGEGTDAEHRRSDHERSTAVTPAVPLPGLFKLPTQRKFHMHSA